ncbi:MAG: hypothetical protein JJT88_02665 [Gammaproteobacteria bacterium]|nr:hypothetical protein [Gammaproteobacteria bacterium]
MQTSSFQQQTRQAIADFAYPDQFAIVSDPLEILIPRQEILAAMLIQGEDRVLDEVCMAVALCADALAAASEAG